MIFTLSLFESQLLFHTSEKVFIVIRIVPMIVLVSQAIILGKKKTLRISPFTRCFAHNSRRCDGIYPPLRPTLGNGKDEVTIQRCLEGG